MTEAVVITELNQRASLRTWVAVLGGIIGAFMAVLDIQITNASLPDIEGGIGTGSSNGTWISTSYLIGEIIMIPLTDYLSRVFSFRRLLLTNACLFLVFSVGCAFAENLTQMIFMRALQGFTGGVMIPMAFTLVLTQLPRSQRPIGIAIFAMTATFAPAVGPTIGGYLTDNFGWQYVFFINVIPGSLMILLLYGSLDRQPLNLGLLKEGAWLSVGCMAVGLAAFQTFLDEGNQYGWFDSDYIIKLACVAAVFLILFIIIDLTIAKPLLPLRLLARRNFGLGTLVNVLVGFALYGSVYVLPTYLGQVQGYDAEQIGLTLAWIGFPQLLLIPFVPILQKYVDARLIVFVGLCIFATSCFMNIHMSANFSGPQFEVSNLVRAMGQAVVLAPLTGIAMVGISQSESAGASGIFNMLRSLGGAIGTAALATFITQREKFHSNIIGQSVTEYSVASQEQLRSLKRYFRSRGTSSESLSEGLALKALADEISQQALIMAFSDTFLALGAILLIAATSIAFTKGDPTVRRLRS
ncbi:MDR family MFS transporter [Phyllobacterium zundukense]|uniref:Multidrug efflux MFS transporter n=1 Tax=Phyllobacterium zundukense TaxID=1867719 RepID=A0ACD4CY15_9HYPH|nr:MDR family MFS transporter [Phyllobacterium zundukense]UXN58485.1 multidrug efflux MFS transporter [Phyllobacterium zundukense]